MINLFLLLIHGPVNIILTVIYYGAMLISLYYMVTGNIDRAMHFAITTFISNAISNIYDTYLESIVDESEELLNDLMDKEKDEENK